MNLELERERGLERCELLLLDNLLDQCVVEGNYLTYCQSNENENRPRPWLFVAPPKILLSTAPVSPVAFCAARHYNKA